MKGSTHILTQTLGLQSTLSTRTIDVGIKYDQSFQMGTLNGSKY